ncbi:hypothetical protein AAII07_44375 [Microvirga sp. 0TCS3.31]
MKELTEATKRSAAHRNDGPVLRAWEGLAAEALGAFVTWEGFMGQFCLFRLGRMRDKRRQPRGYSFTKYIWAFQVHRDRPRWLIQE